MLISLAARPLLAKHMSKTLLTVNDELYARKAWRWRSDNPFVCYGLTFLVSIIFALPVIITLDEVLQAEWSREQAFSLAILFGLWGVVSVWYQSEFLDRTFLIYFGSAVVLGWVFPLFVTFVSWYVTSHLELWPRPMYVLSAIWGIAVALLLRWCPYGPGRPPKLSSPELEPRSRESLLSSLRKTGVSRPERNRVGGAIIPLVFLLILALSYQKTIEFITDSTFLGSDFRPNALAVAAVLLWICGWPTKVYVERHINKVRARSAEEALERNPHRPILYLRSFNIDAQLGMVSWSQRALTALLAAYTPPTAEQQLTYFFRKLGPVIAFGRPGEKIPELGAARFYVSMDSWQERVADVVRVSQLIVWASGTSEGLRWELSYLMKSVAPGQLVLWAHPHLMSLKREAREKEWQLFLGKLGRFFPIALPQRLGEARFFFFGPQFEPIPIFPNEYALGDRQTDAMRQLLAANGMRPRPRWFWRLDNPYVRYGFGYLAGLLSDCVVSAEPPALIDDSGLWGLAFIGLQPVLARIRVPYLIRAALFGLLRYWHGIYVFFNDPYLFSVIGRGVMWGIVLAILLRLLPYAPGRPSKPRPT